MIGVLEILMGLIYISGWCPEDIWSVSWRYLMGVL